MIKRMVRGMLGLLLAIVLLPQNVIKADDSIYQATSTTTFAQLKGVIEGTTLNGAGEKYSGVEFETGTYTIKDSGDVLQLNFNRTFTVNVPTGADVTLEASLMFANSAKSTFTFTGPGKLTIDGKDSTPYKQGINVRSGVKTDINFTNIDFTIKNTVGYGFYSLTNESAPIYTTFSGGKFTMTHCGQTNEGGFDYECGKLEFTNGCVVDVNDCGNTTFGPLYAGSIADIVFSGATKAAFTNSSGAGYVMVINGSNTTSSFGSTGSLIVTDAGTELTLTNLSTSTVNSQGINGGNPELANVIVKDNGSLTINIDNNSAESSGIRDSSIEVTDSGKVEITGAILGLKNTAVKSDTKSVITVDSLTLDIQGTSKAAKVEGGSVLVQQDISYMNGVKTVVPDKVDQMITNFQGEELSRFDLSGLSNTNISIAADPNNAANIAYTYEVGANQAGTAYVWAPAVKITFYGNKNKDPNELIDSRYTIRGNDLTLVNGDLSRIEGGITVPSGQMIVWKNCDDDSVVDVMNQKITEDLNVYYELAEIPPVVNTADNNFGNYFLLLTIISVAMASYVIYKKREYRQ